MNVVVNGAARIVADGVTVADMVHQLDIRDDATGVAAARNGEVVLRSRWHDTTLAEGDSVEVLQAVQGG
ncbi:MAG: sulfur carrier protein ThiS [Candidatus Dormibacteria bacterium]